MGPAACAPRWRRRTTAPACCARWPSRKRGAPAGSGGAWPRLSACRSMRCGACALLKPGGFLLLPADPSFARGFVSLIRWRRRRPRHGRRPMWWLSSPSLVRCPSGLDHCRLPCAPRLTGGLRLQGSPCLCFCRYARRAEPHRASGSGGRGGAHAGAAVLRRTGAARRLGGVLWWWRWRWWRRRRHCW